MKKYFYGSIYISYTFIKFLIIKLLYFKEFRFTPTNAFSPFSEIDLSKRSSLRISKSVKAKSGVRIKVRKGAKVNIGVGTSFNYDCLIISHLEISIGNNVQFGPNVYVYDHDHDFRVKDGLRKLKYKTDPVIIGNNVWIGANVIILKGSVIEDNCIIGAGSIVKGKYKKNSIITQRREEIIRYY